jgi:Cdc6-like AAA superfamily ATPase
MSLDKYEQWLIAFDNKKENSAYHYKKAIPKLEAHYANLKGESVDFFKIKVPQLKEVLELYGLKGKEFDFGDRSKGTNRNALKALYKYRKGNFKSAISQITSDQVNAWFNRTKEKDVPQQVLDDNWRYNLAHNETDKKFPFKWAIRSIAEKNGLALTEFKSSLPNRGLVCELFGVYINEELIYDQTDANTFIAYYHKQVSHKELFQSCMDYASAFSQQLVRDPYDARIAISSDNRIMYFIGMRNVYGYNEKNGEAYINFILDAELEEKIKQQGFKYEIYAYKGGDHKINLYLNLTDWNEIPKFILENHRACLEQEYHEEIKSSIRRWKEDANSTNYALKTIIFDDLDVEDWMNDQKKSDYKIDTIIDTENTTKDLKNVNMMLPPLNQILYGPPGTGKTYVTKELAVQISNPHFAIDKDLNPNEQRAAIIDEYDRLCKEGLIVFSTFHQSMSYEDFVEGIKPITHKGEISYQVESGIFKTSVKNALSEYIDSKEKGEEDFDVLYAKFLDSIKPYEGKREPVFTTKTGVELMLVGTSDSSILVKYLWSNNKKEQPGQHTFSVTKEKLKKVLIEGIVPTKIKSLKAEIHPLVGHIHCELFAVYKTFYDFVVANKGDVETVQFNAIDLSFDDVLEQVSNYSKSELNSKEVKNHTLIIDEINRGNVSAIFGELITLLEDDKRIGKNEDIRIKLPYSKTNNFGVPQNLYIIGTMNTADRSVEALDTALRRRFEFKEMMPDYAVIANEEVEGVFLSNVLKTINERIELLIDRDHTIGHSYFVGVYTEQQLANAFNNKIVPLLQEYFYGDYGKIGLVLGNGFVERKTNKDLKFSSFKYDGKDEFITPTFILKPIDDSNVINAVDQLFEIKDN